MKKPISLIILDGFGINDNAEGNAIKAANTPNIDKLFAENPKRSFSIFRTTSSNMENTHKS